MACKLYVEGFPPSVTQKELLSLFSTFGTVVSADIARTLAGHPMGFAEVVMANIKEAHQAMKALHLVRMHGKLFLVFDDYLLNGGEQRKESLQPQHPLGAR